jgi:hypothetical protein
MCGFQANWQHAIHAGIPDVQHSGGRQTQPQMLSNTNNVVSKVFRTAETCLCLYRLLGLSDVKAFEDLFGQHGPKKGAMKTTTIASRAGAIKQIRATHLGDGEPLTLNMQVGMPVTAVVSCQVLTTCQISMIRRSWTHMAILLVIRLTVLYVPGP